MATVLKSRRAHSSSEMERCSHASIVQIIIHFIAIKMPCSRGGDWPVDGSAVCQRGIIDFHIGAMLSLPLQVSVVGC